MDGAGSGVVVSSDGLILTAAHVIGKTGKKMKVRFPDGKTASAISLGGSEISDAGMLQILDKGPWPFVEIAKIKILKLVTGALVLVTRVALIQREVSLSA